MYELGRGISQDYVKAVEWCRKSAEQGYVYAQYNLGRMYEIGRGVWPNSAKAVEWYQKAAEQGNSKAQHTFGSYVRKW